MPNHLMLLLVAMNVLIGTWVVASTADLAKRQSSPQLRHLNRHTLAFNVGLVLLFLIFYKNLNLSEEALTAYKPLLSQASYLVATLCELFMIDALARLSASLSGRPLRPVYDPLFWGLVIALPLSYAALLFPLPQAWRGDLTRLQSLLFDNVLLLEWLPLLILATRLRRITSRVMRRAARGFVALYLGRYAVFLLALPFALLPRTLRHAVAAVIFIAFNLVPKLWIRHFYAPPLPQADPVDRNAALDRLCETYGISKREREILERILQGKTNREIEKELFISYHTVKNHVYNSFQKLGVKNRYELINAVDALRLPPST